MENNSSSNEFAPNSGARFAEILSGMPLPTSQGSLNVVSTTFSILGKKVYLGRDPYGHPHLLIPQIENLESEKLQLAVMLSVENRVWESGEEKGQSYLDLICESNNADSLFAAIGLAICEKLESTSLQEASQLLGLVSEQIAHWRKVLEAISELEATDSQKIGVIGELLTLEALHLSNTANAFASWHGQEQARHDFEFQDTAYEVKTSTRTSGIFCTIHGLNQLECAKGTQLYLIHYQIEWAAGGDSVGKIIDRLVSLGISEPALQAKLSKIWPSQSSRPNWFSSFEFRVNRAAKYLVDVDFPHINPSTIPEDFRSRFSGLQYSLQLTGYPAEKESSKGQAIMELVTNV